MITPMSRQLRAGAVLLVLTSVALSGCTLPDVSMSPDLGAAPASTTAPPRTPEPAAPATVAVADPGPARPVGDLDTGSTTRTVPAGDRALVVDWWTPEPARQWRAADTKGLQLSAHLEGGDPDLEVLVTRFVATADDGTTRSTVAEDRGEFALQPPYSYGTALVLTPSAADAGQVDLSVQFDLLVETEPGSRRYFRQTVLDSIVLPFLQEETQ
ncbi:hypothetical protein [Geodermatophilus poikilotrophus]|uniref:Lipoprotein n=1 Tax=Geodermatophilus poikilotrophus TaxID=1333667 RepID=A0A1H9ZYJ0_9ACTN|nr:hypothetical protein [Geodermatophilus poikilotrophus]SES86887.1 hypothetical protein SAMN04488546_0838 [Geodermatophilus poikilotrophus]